MKRLLILAAGLTLSCSSSGPPKTQVQAEIAKALPGRLVGACGLLGTEELTVRAIKVSSISADGHGVASADVTNQHSLFGNPPSDCTVRLEFHFKRVGEGWALADLREMR